jgi:hypothetical protein
MKEMQILINKSFDFVVTVDENIVFNTPLDCVDVLEVMTSLCSKYPISAGESTLSLYNFIEEKINEIKAEKEEVVMNKRFFSRVA